MEENGKMYTQNKIKEKGKKKIVLETKLTCLWIVSTTG